MTICTASKLTAGLTGNYGYDPTGNITNNIEGGGSSYAYANPRIQAVRDRLWLYQSLRFVRQHDCAARRLTNSQAMVYDPENQLSAIAQAGSDVWMNLATPMDGARLWKRLNQNPTNIQVWIGNIYEEKGGKVLFHVFAGSEQVCTFETNSPLFGVAVIQAK